LLSIAYGLCQNQRPGVTLNGQYALCCTKRASFGAHHEHLNEDPYYQRQKYRLDPCFWQYKVYAGIRRGSLEKERQIILRLSTTAILVLSLTISSELLEIRLSVNPKMRDLK